MSEVEMTAAHVDAFLATLRQEMLTPHALIDYRIAAGMEERENWNTGLLEVQPNGSRTFTVTVKVNGGARDTVGDPIR